LWITEFRIFLQSFTVWIRLKERKQYETKSGRGERGTHAQNLQCIVANAAIQTCKTMPVDQQECPAQHNKRLTMNEVRAESYGNQPFLWGGPNCSLFAFALSRISSQESCLPQKVLLFSISIFLCNHHFFILFTCPSSLSSLLLTKIEHYNDRFIDLKYVW